LLAMVILRKTLAYSGLAEIERQRKRRPSRATPLMLEIKTGADA
jgi:hypothetical protein